MEGSGSSEDRVPMLDKAAVMVAIRRIKTEKENETEANEKQVQQVIHVRFKLCQVAM